MKKIISLMLAFIMVSMCFSFGVYAQEEDFVLTMQIGNPFMNVNGVSLEIDPGRGTVPITENGRTLVPIRAIIEAMGGTVGWDGNTQKITLTYGTDSIVLNIDSAYAYFNGEVNVLDVVPKTINERTVLPIRFIAEKFKFGVSWDGDTQTISITKIGNIDSQKSILSATQISEKVSPAVFFIGVGDSEGNLIASGSGFFITSDGVAVTNYHVIEDSDMALIQTIDDSIYEVTNVIAFDKELDVAIIKVSKTEVNTGEAVQSFPAVKLADSDDIKAGQKIYTLGSPMGLQNTISDGIISNINRENGRLIQITAPIDHGSSGGALLNEYGEVLGITSSGYDSNANINFAIPINLIKSFDLTAEGMTYAEFAVNNYNFILNIYPEIVEIEIGQTAEVGVYAVGKGDDWSIYWDTKTEEIVDCKWGDWLESNENICYLKITGKSIGTAVVTVYSDVDFQGKDIIVHVKNPTVETYPNPVVRVPSYTAVTGIPLKDHNYSGESDIEMYIYSCYNTDDVIKYMEFLESYGFVFYKEYDEDYGLSYMFITHEDELIDVCLARHYNEVWITLPR